MVYVRFDKHVFGLNVWSYECVEWLHICCTQLWSCSVIFMNYRKMNAMEWAGPKSVIIRSGWQFRRCCRSVRVPTGGLITSRWQAAHWAELKLLRVKMKSCLIGIEMFSRWRLLPLMSGLCHRCLTPSVRTAWLKHLSMKTATAMKCLRNHHFWKRSLFISPCFGCYLELAKQSVLAFQRIVIFCKISFV